MRVPPGPVMLRAKRHGFPIITLCSESPNPDVRGFGDAALCSRRGFEDQPEAAMEFFRKQGQRGGKKSAKARMETMTPEQRTAVAKKAAAASAKVRAAKAAKRKASEKTD